MSYIDIDYFSLDPLLKLYNPDPDIFNENMDTSLYDQLLLEAENTTKKNVLNKIWDAIKNVFKWIFEKFGKLINWIRGIFVKDNTKSVDEIISDIGVTGNTPKVASAKINIPSDEKSQVNMTSSIDLIVKPIITKFNKDKKSIIFNMDDLDHISDKDINNVPNKDRLDNPLTERYIFACIKQPKLIESMVDIFKYINNSESINKSELNELFKKYKSLYDTNVQVIYMKPKFLIECTLEELDVFHNKINEINKMAESFDSPNNIAKINSNSFIINIINDISIEALKIQFGLNKIFSAMNKFYQIDLKYYESIDDIDRLSKVAYELIKARIPYKYIAWNLYTLASKTLKGDGDKYKPIWGQTRVVFIDKTHNCVHKIAMNQGGIRSNIGEAEVYNKFVNAGGNGVSLLTKVYNITSNKCIVDHELVDTSKEKSASEIINLRDGLNAFARKNKIPLDLSADLHAGNVGFRGNQMVAIDYGITRRVETR